MSSCLPLYLSFFIIPSSNREKIMYLSTLGLAVGLVLSRFLASAGRDEFVDIMSFKVNKNTVCMELIFHPMVLT